VSDQGRRIILTCVGDIHLVAHPLRRVLAGVMCFGVVG
jgi:hypothetical protein